MTHDPYWDAVQEQMQNILTIYEEYKDKRPILLFDIQEQRIYRTFDTVSSFVSNTLILLRIKIDID